MKKKTYQCLNKVNHETTESMFPSSGIIKFEMQTANKMDFSIKL